MLRYSTLGNVGELTSAESTTRDRGHCLSYYGLAKLTGNVFGIKKAAGDKQQSAPGGRLVDFAYLDDGSIYLDTACQSMRPQPVMDTLQEYYRTYNACGGRVKYAWGQKVDETIEETRAAVLNLLQLSSKEYVTSFTLNTTYGLNLILQQLPAGRFQRVVTTEIEHNSVFLSTIALSKRLGIERLVLPRRDDGAVQYGPEQLDGAVVVMNVMSNIDGRTLTNMKQLIAETHQRGGIVVIDAAQAMAHRHDLLVACGADAICFSAHKMYSASLGVIVIRHDLLGMLDATFVGGGMVGAVQESEFTLIADDPASRLEPGLQAFGEIIAFKRTLEWLETVKPEGGSRHDYIRSLSQQLYDGMRGISGLEVINQEASPVVTVYSPVIDAHRLAIFLSSAGIMVRSGYFCCHYYLIEQKKYPPLLRFSLGLHNSRQDIATSVSTVQKLITKA